MKHTALAHRQHGAALLEALISILLFSLGVLGIVALQAKATQFSVDSEDRTRAALLANQIVSQMWAQQSTTLDAATLSSWKAQVSATSSGLPAGDGDVSLCIEVDLKNDCEILGLATVTISWKAPWRKSAEQANSYVTKVMIP
ncbi:hypothetical protein [Uliginosibacterium sp. 31-12]|uniref:type IV pilus modification PilV family protein n=1 Tax=Uliginosibacterium sp. 31-12 TaxID=3062781 RepID=UPI0026E3F2D2|nr:hypothetical protein [Uliginosibacterium sp. 31-12]MDO6386583.1 hypothetical protein [Uliginosibacterium sp. 31-12]